MLIQHKFIRVLSSHIPEEYKNQDLRIVVSDPASRIDRLQRAGFRIPFENGDTVLPSIVGPKSRFNAEGKYYPRKDLPKETFYQELWSKRIEFHGPERVENEDLHYIPRERYQKGFIPPAGVELQIVSAGIPPIQLIATDLIRYNPDEPVRLLSAINICLEHFGECEVRTADLIPVINVPIRRLNWRMLPTGVMTWETLRTHLEPLLAAAKTPGARKLLAWRIEAINKFEPIEAAVGEGGFGGYLAFMFPAKDLNVLESAYTGNATYIFGENWEELSKMTKAQILAGHLEKHRLVHDPAWEARITQLLKA